jgi:hypothetical protein
MPGQAVNGHGDIAELATVIEEQSKDVEVIHKLLPKWKMSPKIQPIGGAARQPKICLISQLSCCLPGLNREANFDPDVHGKDDILTITKLVEAPLRIKFSHSTPTFMPVAQQEGEVRFRKFAQRNSDDIQGRQWAESVNFLNSQKTCSNRQNTLVSSALRRARIGLHPLPW